MPICHPKYATQPYSLSFYIYLLPSGHECTYLYQAKWMRKRRYSWQSFKIHELMLKLSKSMTLKDTLGPKSAKLVRVSFILSCLAENRWRYMSMGEWAHLHSVDGGGFVSVESISTAFVDVGQMCTRVRTVSCGCLYFQIPCIANAIQLLVFEMSRKPLSFV